MTTLREPLLREKAVEPFLEPIVRWFRYQEIQSCLIHGQRVVDFGCGPSAPLWRHFGQEYFSSYVGVDPLTSTAQLNETAYIKCTRIESTHLPAASANTVVLSAVLEHVDDPARVLAEAYRVLQMCGMIIITVPTWQAKPILEFLSAIGLIARREIEEHKRYFNAEELRTLLERAGFRDVRTKYFEFGGNLLALAKK
jgi:ubiquinone/menaquinone biosynthesis C-methylase UbiE